ncbi:toxin HipA [Pseudomonas sp. PIC25]|uniref:HipA domain-containing protein n=1 Tax=Pseudomonas sp. PIC25 TaxID=1958773 RepID=UPI000BAB93EC|nr:HipA domain-containing protein [Pseudomonas sp. PIC25]PAU65985.1 toxin HipA [Pseudomonas sp. PIC25]
MTRALNVWINHTLIGVLRERNGLWTFGYSQAWLGDPAAYPLCPGLPLQAEEHVDGATYRPVQWYFDNLLPEEGLRVLMARVARVSDADAFGLLAHFGAESAGSITLLPSGEAQPAEGSLLPLPGEELSRRIREMPRVPLVERSAKRMSLAGAQHKVAIVYDGRELLEPTGNIPSTHILKPDHPDEAWAHSVINEWFVMRLASRVGLTVPAVYRRYVPESVYLIERFDRHKGAAGWVRLHCIDACQLLGLDRSYKYAEGSMARLAEIASQCLPPARARLSLFQWLVFNVLVGNEDAHLKNLSFLIGGRTAVLAPFYDLLCTAVYGTRAFGQDRWPQQAAMAWPILGIQRLQQIGAAELVAAGEAMGIKPGTARTTIDKLVAGVRDQAQVLLTEVEQENALLRKSDPAIQAMLAGEMRLLRAIVNIVIVEMAQQLSA